MQRHRILFLVLACAAGSVAAAFHPRIQTWALHRLVARHPGWGFSFGSVRLGLGQAEIRDLRLEREGATFDAPAVDLDWNLFELIFERRLHLVDVTARGWTLDGSRVSLRLRPPPARAGDRPGPDFSLLPSAVAAETSAEVRIFPGLFHRFDLPCGLRLDGLDASGVVLLPPAHGAPAVRAAVQISGGGLDAEREGTFPFRIDAAIVGSPVGAVEIEGLARAAMDTPKTFSRLSVRATAAATGKKFPQGIRLTVDFRAARGAAGETYALGLAREAKQLVSVTADFPYGGASCDGTWRLDVRDDDLAPFALGRPLPMFVAFGRGRFETDAAFSSLQASGELSATTDRLRSVWSGWPAAGPIKVAAAFDLACHRSLLRVDRLTLALSGGRPIAAARALQAFQFDFRSGELEVANPAGDLFDLALQGVPLAWLQPYAGSFGLSGGDIRGEILAGARGGGVALSLEQPMEVSGLAVSRAGRPLLAGCDLRLDATADYTPAGWQAAVSSFAARDAARNAVTLDFKIGRLAGPDQPIKTVGRLTASLADASAQPGLAEAAALKSGSLTCEFSGSFADRSMFEARFAAANFGDSGSIAPALTLDFRADQDASGAVRFLAPIAVSSAERNSDLTIAGTVRGGGFEAQAQSSSLALRDCAFLGALWSVARPLDGAGWRGTVALDLKRVEGEAFSAAAVSGSLRFSPGEVDLAGLRANLAGGSALRLDGSLRRAAEGSRPYALQADLAVSHFDPAPFCRSLAPGQPPAIEGRFDLAAQLSGQAGRLEDLAPGLESRLKLTSRRGVFRLLSAHVQDSIAAAKRSPSLLAEAVGAVGSLFGAKDDASGAAGRFIDKQGQIVLAIADRLKEIRYDQLDVRMSRGADRDWKLESCSLIAPEVRLSGSGLISCLPGKSLADQPISLSLDLGARGQLGDLMGQAGLLSAQKDDLGYTQMIEPLRLAGTLGRVDSRQWEEVMIRATLHKAEDSLLDKLFGR